MTDTQRTGAADLPSELEAALYAACLEAADPAAAVEGLVARAPEHEGKLRDLARSIVGARGELRAFHGGAHDTDSLAPGMRLFGYRIEQELGRGAFGVVYLARQETPVRRQVAIKLLTHHSGAPEVLQRFAAERDVMAGLDHPGIARVFDAGAASTGQPFFVMEYVPGLPVHEFADANHLSLEGRLRLFVQICEVVQHAHQNGVLHRDLKPSNLLVRWRERTIEVKVIDFGLAKVVAATATVSTEPTSTEAGRLLGTPEYMSPEQARGQQVDTRTDVHALGVVLFQLVTGALPFASEELRAQGIASIVRILDTVDAPLASSRIAATAPAACGTTARDLRAALRGDLDLVIATCLAKDRGQRYASVAELAADVVRHLEHQPLGVRPPRLAYVLRKLFRRHRVVGVAAVVALVSLLATAAVLAWSVRHVGAARDVAEANAYASVIGAARAALESDRAAEARDHLAHVDPARIGLEYELLAAATEDATRIVPTGVRYGGFVAAGGRAWSTDRDTFRLVITDPRGEAADRRITLPRDPVAIAADPTGKLVAVVMAGGIVQLRDQASARVVRTFTLPGDSGDWAAFTNDGTRLCVPARRELWIVDVATGAVLHRCQHRDNIWTFDVDGRGNRIAVGDHSGDVRIWDSANGTQRDVLETGAVACRVRFHPRRDVLFVADERGTIRAFDLQSRKSVAAQRVDGAHVFDLVCGPAGDRLLSCHADGSVRLWDTDSLLDRGVFRGHRGDVARAAAQSDGTWWTMGADRTLRVWPADVPSRAMPLRGVRGTPLRLVLSPTSLHLHTATLGGMVATFDLTTNERVWAVESGRDRCHGLAVVDGVGLWVTSAELLQCFDAATGAVRTRVLPLPGKQLRDLRLRDGGRELVVVASDLTIARCDARSGAVLATLPPLQGPTGEPYTLLLPASTGAAIVSGPDIGARAVDLDSGVVRWQLAGSFCDGVVDPQRGLLLLLQSDSRLVEVEPSTGTVRREVWRGDGSGAMVALAADHSRILVSDGRLHVIAKDTGRDLFAVSGGTYGVCSVVADPARGVFVTGGGHFVQPAELRRWPLAPRRRD